jgi:hypothetical protein
MPVTAKLSKKFYDTFGDEIANELVNWFNQVDATYRSEFKDLFEVHFSKFDSKLEQRTAELRGEMQERLAQLEAKLEQRTAELRTGLHAVEVRLIRWMFLFWIGSLGTTIALIKL